LVDSLDDITASLNHVLAARDLPTHSRETVEGFVGEGARILVERALPPGVDVDAVLAEFRARYAAHLTDHTRAYDGVRELLAELARREVPTAVLSNKPHDMTVGVVAALFEGHAFVRVLGQRDGVPRKPDPASALELGAALEPPVAFVGDTPVDVATARAAGMTAIAVAWGMRDVALLREAGAEVVLERPADLLAHLAR
ncbi:MAG: HAD-IA family hydrolase, partial [Myxococcales bacterium]|nr:HAD-IA family hydrolase [Myxococcales bacterium]